jgi:hypothetical protein
MSIAHKIPEEIIIHILQFFPTNKKNLSINKNINHNIFSTYDKLIKNMCTAFKWLNTLTLPHCDPVIYHEWDNQYSSNRLNSQCDNIHTVKNLVDKLYNKNMIKLNIRLYANWTWPTASHNEICIHLKKEVEKKIQLNRENKYQRPNGKLKIGVGEATSFKTENITRLHLLFWY